MASKMLLIAAACIGMVSLASATVVPAPCGPPCNSNTAIMTAMTTTILNCQNAVATSGGSIVMITWVLNMLTLVISLCITLVLPALLVVLGLGVSVTIIASLCLLILQIICNLVNILVLRLQLVITLTQCQQQCQRWFITSQNLLIAFNAANPGVTLVINICLAIIVQINGIILLLLV